MRSWRVGRKVGRTIYIQLGDKPSDEDQLVGMMDNSYIARLAVDRMNSDDLLLRFIDIELGELILPSETAAEVAVQLLRHHYNPAIRVHPYGLRWLCPRCRAKRRRIRDG